MVILLVLLTLALILTAEWIGGRRRGGAPEPARPRRREAALYGGLVVEGRYVHPGHTWARVDGPRSAVVGADDFARRLLGRADEIELPEPGRRVAQGDPLFVLRRGTRQLVQCAPISGVVTSVNRGLQAAPELWNDSPGERGWIATLAPANLAVELRNLLHGRLAERWDEAARAQLVEWFSPRMGTALLQDGGELVDGVGDLLSDGDWELVVKDFFPGFGQPESTPAP
jgi:glycine cleavage system H protein